MNNKSGVRWLILPLILVAVLMVFAFVSSKNAMPPASEKNPWREIAKSEQGRSIEAASFGDGPMKVLVLAGVHGNELGPAIARELGTRLARGQSKLPSGVTVYIVPDVNPDGRAARSRGNANGVDLNRNFPTSNWRTTLNPKDSSRKKGLTGGASPGSEIGTGVILGYLDKGTRRVIALHSQGGFVDWDGAKARPLAKRVSAATGLPLKHVPYQKYIGGSLGQYAKGRAGLDVITLELDESVDLDTALGGLLAAMH